MSEVSNPIQACSDIFFKPNGVFAATNVNHNWSWLPFIAVIVITVLPAYMYFNFVDFEWYTDLIVNSTYADVSPNEQDMIRQNMTRDSVLLFSFVGAFVGYIVLNSLLAIYLNLSTKSDEDSLHGFTDWFGFTWWVSMPSLVSAVLALLMLTLAESNQLDPASLSPTSLAYWAGLDVGSQWYALAQSIRLESFWSMYLIAVGISQWTNIRGNKTYIIGIAPYAFIWGVWTLINLF